MPNLTADKQNATLWAQDHILSGDFVILDTETTGLDTGTAEIVQIAICDHLGQPLLDVLVKPQHGIPEDAIRIHGITETHVKNAAGWYQVYPYFLEAIRGKTVLVYNLDYDYPLIAAECARRSLPIVSKVNWQCVCKMYAQWYGEWNYRQGRYKFQRLTGGDHSALGDCRATLNVLHKMAGGIEVDGIWQWPIG